MRLLHLLLPIATLMLAAGNAAASGEPDSVLAAATPDNDELQRLIAEEGRFRTRFLVALPRLQVEHLYYIDPLADRDKGGAGDRVDGYVVLSHAKITGSQTSHGALQESLRRMVESTPGYTALCFDPHHVVVLSNGKEQFYAIVCFDCSSFRLFSTNGDGIMGSFEVAEEAAWDKAFAHAGLKRPPHQSDE